MINFRVLLKAMSFMFLPTLGVLLMLVVGFFDPVAMWNWIKSDNGWAIFTRIALFLAEIGLITVLYFYYFDKEKRDAILKEGRGVGKKQRTAYDQYVFRVWYDNSQNHYFYIQATEDPNIQILIREPKAS